MSGRVLSVGLSVVLAVGLCYVPRPVLAGDTEKQKKEEKKNEREKKSDSKGKKGVNPIDEVNKMWGGFKKGSSAAREDAGKARDAVNDAWNRSK